MDSFNDVLSAAKAYCKERLVDATYNLYIDGLEAVSFEGSGKVVLAVRNDFICTIVRDRYTPLLKEALAAVLGFDVEVELVVPAAAPEKPAPEPEKPAPVSAPSGKYDFTFENFIKGPSNQFAYAAAQAVASNPSGAYNPLFIYGQSGLGKTHLLNAIQVEIKKNHPDFNIVYVDCEKFTNEIITAIREGNTESFRQKYRAADVLLVDDIQFIAGKEST
ncbi:DnaA/Hda family protein, partial [Fournierella sp.]